MTITLPVGVNPSDVTLAGTQSVSIDVGASMANGDGTFGTVASDGTTHLWGGAKSGNVVGIGTVQLDGFSSVNGTLQSTVLPIELPLSKVTGATTISSAIAPPQSFGFPISLPSTNSGDLLVLSGTRVSLTTSARGNVSILPLGTLDLSAGSYFFDSLNIAPTATLNVDTTSGPVFITVRNNITSFLGVMNNSNPGKLLVTVLGTGTTLLGAPFSGTVIAPSSQIVLAPFAHKGSFFGQSIDLQAAATVAHVPLAFALPAAGDIATASTFTAGTSPGDLVIDASGQKTLFPAPTDVRTFNTRADLINFAAQKLNAVVIKDASGNPIGAEGTTSMIGTATTVDAVGNSSTVVDPVLEFLGGPSGTVVVGGQTLCLDQTKCGGAPATPPLDPCSPTGQFCTDDSSWKTDVGPFYHSVGSSTNQTKGGYNSHQYVCLKCACDNCFFSWVCTPWLCTRTSGSNELRLTDTFFVSEQLGPVGEIAALTRPFDYKNVNSINDNMWSLFVEVTLNSDGQLTGGGGGGTFASVAGVCGVHVSSGVGGAEGSVTKGGSVPANGCAE